MLRGFCVRCQNIDKHEKFSRSFSDHFSIFSVPPDHVRIKKEPEELRAGTIATLTCDGSSSNPPAEMSWWREGISVTEGIANSSKSGLHGGIVSSITLRLNVTSEIDGDVYTCQASNTALMRSAHEAITMNVLCKLIPVYLHTVILNTDIAIVKPYN